MAEDQVQIKKQTDESEKSICCHTGDHFPYGTALTFEDDMVSDLGVDMLEVGDVVEVRGYAFVDRKTSYSNESKEDGTSSNKSMCFQMTSVKISRETKDRADQLYGEKS